MSLEEDRSNIREKFKFLNFYQGGGKDFYYKEIENLIETYFNENNIEYKKLTQGEIIN